MPDRQNGLRADSADRRTFPRPPRWLNLALLIIAAATFAYARYHRSEVEEKTAALFRPNPNSPAELNRMRDELSRMEVSREQLARELDGRMQYVKSLEGEDFYISIDTKRRKLEFRIGQEIVRDADVAIGEARTIEVPGGKTWTFVPLKGGFNVVDKVEGMRWRVPVWVYAMKGDPGPAERPSIRNGLGRYVVVLPNQYVIHSPPSPESPLQGPKPGSFMVPEADLAAIWPRITKSTRVYIF